MTTRAHLYDVKHDTNHEPNDENAAAPATNRNIQRLPRINIPEFSGHREDWEAFRDLFKSLIHQDSSLTNVEKPFYLKSHVRGEAKTALSSLQVTAANYAIAWSTLESRYDQRRLLVRDQLMAIKRLRPLKVLNQASGTVGHT